MATIDFFIGVSNGQGINYRWRGLCTDFLHTEGSDSFSGIIWLRDGQRLVNFTPEGTIPDFTMTVTDGSWDEENSSASFAPTGTLPIMEPDIARSVGGTSSITGTADRIEVTDGGFSGSFSTENEVILTGFGSLGALVHVSGRDFSTSGSTSFSWIRNASACLTPV